MNNEKILLYRSQMQRSANKKTHRLPHSLDHHNYTTGSLEDHDYTEREGVSQVVELKEYEDNSNNVEDKDYYFMDTTIIGWS